MFQNGPLIEKHDNLCLTASNQKTENQVTLQPCEPQNPSQLWKFWRYTESYVGIVKNKVLKHQHILADIVKAQNKLNMSVIYDPTAVRRPIMMDRTTPWLNFLITRSSPGGSKYTPGKGLAQQNL